MEGIILFTYLGHWFSILLWANKSAELPGKSSGRCICNESSGNNDSESRENGSFGISLPVEQDHCWIGGSVRRGWVKVRLWGSTKRSSWQDITSVFVPWAHLCLGDRWCSVKFNWLLLEESAAGWLGDGVVDFDGELEGSHLLTICFEKTKSKDMLKNQWSQYMTYLNSYHKCPTYLVILYPGSQLLSWHWNKMGKIRPCSSFIWIDIIQSSANKVPGR